MLIGARTAAWGGGKSIFRGLRLTAVQQNSSVRIEKIGSPYDVGMTYSTDGLSWIPYTYGSSITITNIGDFVCFIADGNYDGFSKGWLHSYTIFSTGKVSVSGNINSLLKIDFENVTEYKSKGVFYDLFNSNTALVDAYDLELPTLSLTDACYGQMFQSCSNLIRAPRILPAPLIPYEGYKMFVRYCNKLVYAPIIMGEAEKSYAIYKMFSGCSSLDRIEVHFKSWPYHTEEFTLNVKQTGTFLCPIELGTNETIQRGDAYCPQNWTVENI